MYSIINIWSFWHILSCNRPWNKYGPHPFSKEKNPSPSSPPHLLACSHSYSHAPTHSLSLHTALVSSFSDYSLLQSYMLGCVFLWLLICIYFCYLKLVDLLKVGVAHFTSSLNSWCQVHQRNQSHFWLINTLHLWLWCCLIQCHWTLSSIWNTAMKEITFQLHYYYNYHFF